MIFSEVTENRMRQRHFTDFALNSENLNCAKLRCHVSNGWVLVHAISEQINMWMNVRTLVVCRYGRGRYVTSATVTLIYIRSISHVWRPYRHIWCTARRHPAKHSSAEDDGRDLNMIKDLISGDGIWEVSNLGECPRYRLPFRSDYGSISIIVWPNPNINC